MRIPGNSELRLLGIFNEAHYIVRVRLGVEAINRKKK